MIPLGNSVVFSGYVTYNTWNYYSFQVSATSSLSIVLKETSTTGDIFVYVAKSFPTLDTYLYADTNPYSNIHALGIDLADQESAIYQIGVFGNSNLLSGQSAGYQIVAYAPDF